MASKDVKLQSNRSSENHNFSSLKVSDDIYKLIKNLLINLEECPERDTIEIKLRKFVTIIVETFKRIKTTKCQRDFVDACKTRSDELSEIISKLTVVSDISNVSLGTSRNGKIISLYHNGDNIWRKDNFYPKVYKVLIDLIIYVLKQNTIDINIKYEYLRIISSVGAIYNDIRPNKEEILYQEKEMVKRLSQPPKYQSYYEFCRNVATDKDNLEFKIIETIKYIQHYVNSAEPLSQIPRIYRSIVKAIRDMQLEYPDVHYNMINEPNCSFSACGTYTVRNIKGKEYSKSMPALLASAFEDDWVKDYIPDFDRITGFNLEYGQLKDQLQTRSEREITISIEQKKFSRRGISISGNPVQDRLAFYHHRISSVLKNLDTDCTFDQEAGRVFSRKATENSKQDIYCFDWSKATDTMLSGAQAQVIQDLILYHYGFEAAHSLKKCWLKLVQMPMKFRHIDKTETRFRIVSGQPQGYLSSFPSFALLHHIIMITNYRIIYGLDTDIRGLYRVLGDDSIFLSPDRSKSYQLKTTYKALSEAVNVECNLSKGYIYEGVGNPIAEFAKVKSVKGVYFTNTPINIVCRAKLSTEDALKYIIWLKTYTDCPIQKEDLIEKLNEIHPVSDKEQKVITHLLYSSMPNDINRVFGYEIPELGDIKIDDYKIFRLQLIDALNRSIIRSIIPDGLREDNEETQEAIGLSRIRFYNKVDFSSLEFNLRSKLGIMSLQDNIFIRFIDKYGADKLPALQEATQLKWAIYLVMLHLEDLS